MKYPLGPRLRIKVTREQIAKAITAHSGRCWIAEAIKEAYPKATSVHVDVATCRFSDLDRGHRYVYITPLQAQLALLKFDEGTPPPAFDFTLKNAHVTKAGGTPRKEGKKPNRRRGEIPKKTILVGGDKKTGVMPRKVGGRRPPQLRMLRQFGIRAFAGADLKRLEADAEAVRRAEEMQR